MGIPEDLEGDDREGVDEEFDGSRSAMTGIIKISTETP